MVNKQTVVRTGEIEVNRGGNAGTTVEKLVLKRR